MMMRDLPARVYPVTYPQTEMTAALAVQGDRIAYSTVHEEVVVLQLHPDQRPTVLFTCPSAPSAGA